MSLPSNLFIAIELPESWSTRKAVLLATRLEEQELLRGAKVEVAVLVDEEHPHLAYADGWRTWFE